MLRFMQESKQEFAGQPPEIGGRAKRAGLIPKGLDCLQLAARRAYRRGGH